MSSNSANTSVHIEHVSEKVLLYSTMVMLVLFCIMGTIGNAIVMLVYIQKRNKVPASIFILTLACTDFCTCVIIIPLTIVMEYFHYQIDSDIACKVYMFLITTNVPFSAFIIAAIAVDRYLRICFPFSNYLSSRGAKLTVLILSFVSIAFGILTALNYGTQPKEIQNIDSSFLKDIDYDALLENSTFESGYELLLKQFQNKTLDEGTLYPYLDNIILNPAGFCRINQLIFSETFTTVYHKVYSSCFVIVLFIVLLSYTLIFRYVIKRRAIKRRMRSSSSLRANVNLSESTSCSMKVVMTNGQVHMKLIPTLSILSTIKSSQPLRVPVFEKSVIANIRTALMLFIVTAVFILAFLPAWLMSHGVVKYSMPIFYIYFIYNITNPIIYSFMNQHFRKSMSRLFQCYLKR